MRVLRRHQQQRQATMPFQPGGNREGTKKPNPFPHTRQYQYTAHGCIGIKRDFVSHAFINSGNQNQANELGKICPDGPTLCFVRGSRSINRTATLGEGAHGSIELHCNKTLICFGANGRMASQIQCVVMCPILNGGGEIVIVTLQVSEVSSHQGYTS